MTSREGPRTVPRGPRGPVPRGRPPRGAAPIDRLDEAILLALQADGRASLRRVAREVGVSVTTVSGRLRALERLGVLQGFVPLLSVQRLAAVGRSPCCTVVRILPRASDPDDVERLAHHIAEAPGICYLFELSGSNELMALASTASRAETETLLHVLRRVPGVARVRPTPIVRVHKERPNHPVGTAALPPPCSTSLTLPA